MSKPLSPEARQAARQFLSTIYGKDFLEHLKSCRPVTKTDPQVHNFAFSAGQPAGFDAAIEAIEAVQEEERKERDYKPDTI